MEPGSTCAKGAELITVCSMARICAGGSAAGKELGLKFDSFLKLARTSAQRPALVINASICTYGELVEGMQRWRSTLGRTGIPARALIGLTGAPCTEMIMLLLALAHDDHVVVPFLSESARETQDALATADVDGWFHFECNGTATWTPRMPGARHPLLELLHLDTRKPGLILFTSGSSGASKAVVHDFSRIWRRCELPDREPKATLVFLMIDHIGGINTLLHVLLSGGTAVFPPDRTVESVCRAIQDHRVELLPTTPTFLNMFLLSGHRERYDLSSLAMVTYGTEPMLPSTLLGLKQALPTVRCKQTYGMTEIGILPTRSEDDDSVWLKVGGPGFETRIVDSVLWVRADTSMLGYLNAPSPFDDAGWLNTGDLVEAKEGYIRILGRASEIINVGGEKVSPSEIEDVILQVENVEEVIVRQKANAITGQIVVAFVRVRNDEDHSNVSARVREYCRARLSPYKVPVLIHVTQTEMMSRRFKKIWRPELDCSNEQGLRSAG